MVSRKVKKGLKKNKSASVKKASRVSSVPSGSHAGSHRSPMMSIIDHVKILHLIRDPRGFFTDARKEDSYRPSWSLYVIVALLVTAVQSFSRAVIVSSQGVGFAVVAAGFVGGLLGGLIAAMILPFLAAAITHLGVLLVKGAHGFLKTFKASTYPQVVGELYMLLIWVVYALCSIPTVDGGMGTLSPLLLVIIVAIFAVMVVHVLCLEILGISILQKVTISRAVIAVMVPTLGIIAAMIVAMMVIVVMAKDAALM